MTTKKNNSKKTSKDKPVLIKIAETVGTIAGEISVKKDQLVDIASHAIDSARSAIHNITAENKVIKKAAKAVVKKAAKAVGPAAKKPKAVVNKKATAVKKTVKKAAKKAVKPAVKIAKTAVKKTVKKVAKKAAKKVASKKR